MASSGAADEGDRNGRRRFLAIAGLLTLLALLLRLTFYAGARVDDPVRGDVIQYVAYAWNLLHHATFSSSEPGSAVVVPDSFRGPGYPLFLALCMAIAREQPGWTTLAAVVQIAIGAALVPLTIVLARQWQGRGAALVAGALVAVWPHEIVFAGTLLGETLFCAALLLACLAFSAADRRDSIASGSVAGVAAGCAYLINPVVAFFPFVVAALLWLRARRRAAASLALVSLLVLGAWAARNHGLAPSSSAWDRAAANIVEGSWPQYHAAYNSRFVNETSAAIMRDIGNEERLMATDPGAGARALLDRFALDPGYYIGWYLLKKPFALWSWDVRIGWGDVYFLETHESPFNRYAALRVLHAVCRALNPVLFLLALIAACAYGLRPSTLRQATSIAASVVGLLFLYLTAVHTVFQADPRYAVAYRPLEMVLAVSAAMCAFAWARRVRQRAPVPAAGSASA